MSHDLPPLNALRAFEATARLNSVSQAAEQLHVTHGAVSRQLKVLEEHLGVSLFIKEGRGLKLTDAGIRLRDASGEAFERLRTRLRRTDPKHRRCAVRTRLLGQLAGTLVYSALGTTECRPAGPAPAPVGWRRRSRSTSPGAGCLAGVCRATVAGGHAGLRIGQRTDRPGHEPAIRRLSNDCKTHRPQRC